MGDRQPGPEQQLVGAGRELGGAAVQRAGLLGALGGHQLVGRAGQLVGAPQREQPLELGERVRRGPRRAGRRARATPRPPAGTTSSAADWRPRTSPPSPSAACSAASSRAGEVAARRPRTPPTSRPARCRAPSCSPGSSTSRRWRRRRGRCSPGRWRRPRRRARRPRRPGAPSRSGSAVEQRLQRLAAAPSPAWQPVERVRAVRGLDDRLRGDRADARARPGAERADAEPVRLDRGAELAGARGRGRRSSRCRGAWRARIPAVPSREDRVLDRIRNTPEGFVRAYGDVSPGRAALRGHGARRQRRPDAAVVADRARGRLAREGRPPARAARGRGHPVPRRPRRHARARAAPPATSLSRRVAPARDHAARRARAASTSSRARSSRRCPSSATCGPACCTCSSATRRRR